MARFAVIDLGHSIPNRTVTADIAALYLQYKAAEKVGPKTLRMIDHRPLAIASNDTRIDGPCFPPLELPGIKFTDPGTKGVRFQKNHASNWESAAGHAEIPPK